MTAKDARLLKVATNAFPRLLYFDKFKIFVVLLDYVFCCLKLFGFVMNALGELMNYLLENGFAYKVPDFFQLGIVKYVLVLHIFQLILMALSAQFFEVERNLLDYNSEGLGVRQHCLD